MKYIPYDSRDTLYKSVFGAVEAGNNVTFRLLLHRDAKVKEAFFLLRADDGGYLPYKMAETGAYDENYNWYEYTLSVADAGLYFYKFRYTSEYGDMFVTRHRFSEGLVSKDGGEWQLTVYRDNGYPKDFAGGIIYQIFPDRFCNSGKAKKNVPADRCLRADWGGTPAYLQNNDICHLGNDYFGGDLKGIESKLDYLASLGVTAIYLNPIFEAHSNHRYNTADYLKIDSLLGDDKDFQSLCNQADKKGIKIIIDGVFSHTGDDSRYFNLYGRYDDIGAAQSQDSPYRSWFNFNKWPDSYSCWWGVPSLPETNENNEDYKNFITGEGGVVEKWLSLGAGGIRLDVADELPDEFLDSLCERVKITNPNAIIIGEVWEDATNKISYGVRRRYLLGDQLHSVMNYPFANLIFEYVLGGDGFKFMDGVLSICENYPKPALNLLMNHIGTHDTARALTVLGLSGNLPPTRADQAKLVLTPEQYEQGKKLLKLAAAIQYTLPGIPSLYYGDEAGLTGGADPFCRGCYPWGNEDKELLEFYKKLGDMRKNSKAFKGDLKCIHAGLGLLCYEREYENEKILVAVNRWQEDDVLEIPNEWQGAELVFGEMPIENKLTVRAKDFVILQKNK